MKELKEKQKTDTEEFIKLYLEQSKETKEKLFYMIQGIILLDKK